MTANPHPLDAAARQCDGCGLRDPLGVVTVGHAHHCGGHWQLAPQETDFCTDIECPVCGAEDGEHGDYPSFGDSRDGATAHWTCWNCGADCVVTLCVEYTFSARLEAKRND